METRLKKLDDIGIETSAFKVLCLLSFNNKPLKPLEIAEWISEKPSTVRARLSELKEYDLVLSTPDGYLSKLNQYDVLMKLYRELKKELCS